MLALLFSAVLSFATDAHAGGRPKLINELSTNSGCEKLLKYSLPEARIGELSPDEAADELVELLTLTHPLVILYLAGTDFHGDLRLLSLIWGDQHDFDLRKNKLLAGRSPFEVFKIRSSNWIVKDRDARASMASEFLDEIANIQWTINRQISSSTIYTGNHKSDMAFQTGRPGWMADFPRHWEVNDDFNIALRLHETIHELRMRIHKDKYMNARLKEILTENLPTIAKPTTQFLEKYEFFLESGDPDAGFMRTVKK